MIIIITTNPMFLVLYCCYCSTIAGQAEKKHLPSGHVGAARLTNLCGPRNLLPGSALARVHGLRYSKPALPSRRPSLVLCPLPDDFQKITRIVLSPPLLTILGRRGGSQDHSTRG